MPASRARTAICSAPLECPSRPGLPTRIFGRRPSCSCSRETSSRSSVELRVRRFVPAGLADAGGGAVAAEHLAQRARPLAGGGARARGGDRRDHQVLLRGSHRGDPGQVREGRVDGPLVALGAPAAHGLDLLGLHGGVDDQDAALGVVGQRRDAPSRRSGSGRRRPARRTRSGGCAAGGSRPERPSCTARPRRRRRARRRRPSRRARPPAAPRRARPSQPSPRRCRGTRAGRSRRPSPAGSAATTADPRGGGARAPRSRPAAGSRARGRRARA